MALTSATTPVEQLVKDLAPHLKQSDAEVRIRLSGPPPRVVRVCHDKAAALGTLRFLREAGHDATACDARAICCCDEMASLQDARFQTDGILATLPDGAPTLIAYDDVVCLLPALHDRPVLYLFQRGGKLPALLRQATRTDVARTSRAPDPEFTRHVHEFRKALPKAAYDERLLTADVAAATAVLRAGDGPPLRASRLSVPDHESTVTHRSWPVSIDEWDGLIPRDERPELAERRALDVLAHLTALCYARGYF